MDLAHPMPAHRPWPGKIGPGACGERLPEEARRCLGIAPSSRGRTRPARRSASHTSHYDRESATGQVKGSCNGLKHQYCRKLVAIGQSCSLNGESQSSSCSSSPSSSARSLPSRRICLRCLDVLEATLWDVASAERAVLARADFLTWGGEWRDVT